jgi:5'-methylthioadenosine phosphorylase
VLGSSLLRSPFEGGEPRSAEVAGGDGRTCTVELVDHGAFVELARHGAHGRTPAHLVDHHAHVRALLEAGCDRVLAIGSCGSLRAERSVGTLVAPDDLLALSTYATFHDSTDGYALRGFDGPWRAQVLEACTHGSRPVVDGGTYAQVRGPRFETPAEVRFLASFADLVGMTLAAECMLAAEAGLRYAAICQVDNLANGIAPHDASTADVVSAVDAYLDNTRVLHQRFADDITAVVLALSEPAAVTGRTDPS